MLGLAVLVGCGGGGTMAQADAPLDGASCDPAADTCTGDTLCVANACAPAWPRAYRVADFVIHVPTGFTNDPDGKPDLQPEVATGNPSPLQDVTPIPVSANTNDLTLPGPFDLTLMSSNTALLVGVSDVDPALATPRVIVDCLDMPTAAMLRQRTGGCANGGATISYKIAPRTP